MCHSQWSSSWLPSAAQMPPWAAPVWERVGYSLVSTALLTPLRASSSAAQRPAPPAPTMTAWYSWIAVWPTTRAGVAALTCSDRAHERGQGQSHDHLCADHEQD